MGEEDVPEGRCGVLQNPGDIDWEAARSHDRRNEASGAARCWRTVRDGADSDRCLWHAEVEAKPVEDLVEARADEPERLDGAYLRGADLGEAISFEDCGLRQADLRDANLQAATLGGADLRGATLEEADLGGATLEEADLGGATLSDADLEGADLSDADLESADLRRTRLADATLRGARLGHADLQAGELPEADLRSAELPEAKLGGAVLGDGKLAGADLREADLAAADFENADLREADLSNATLEGATLRNAELWDAELRDAELQEANLSAANLSAANLAGAVLRHADLGDAVLREAVLGDADLRRAVLRGSDLQHAELGDADLRRAVLEDADLSFADLPGAELRRADLEDAGLKDADLQDANLRSARLRGADMSHATVVGADLTDAHLTDANLRNTDLGGAVLENAVLTATDLRDADLVDTALYQAFFSDIRMNNQTEFGDRCRYELEDEEPDDGGDATPLEAAAWTYRRVQTLHEENALAQEARRFHFRKAEAYRKFWWRRFFDIWSRPLDDPFEWTRRLVRAGTHSVNRSLSKHGDSPVHVMVVASVVIISSAFVYPLFGIRSTATETHRGLAYAPSLLPDSLVPVTDFVTVFSKSLYFSVVTFTTLGYGDLQPVGFAQLLATVESLAGGLLMALLVFVLGRRATW